MSRKKEISFDLDKLALLPADLRIVRLADVGLLAKAEISRQTSEELVCGCGQIVVDGKLIKDDGLFAVERTAAVSKLIEAGLRRDQGVWIKTADRRANKARSSLHFSGCRNSSVKLAAFVQLMRQC